MKKLILMMLISTPLSAQLSNPPLIIANHPLGTCPNGQLALDIIDNTNWICNGGWVQLTSGAGAVSSVFGLTGVVPDLIGDVTTSGSTTTTVIRVNGVTYSSSPTSHTVPVITASNVATYTSIPNCTDITGNHLNYTQSTDLFSCGTSISSITWNGITNPT